MAAVAERAGCWGGGAGEGLEGVDGLAGVCGFAGAEWPGPFFDRTQNASVVPGPTALFAATEPTLEALWMVRVTSERESREPAAVGRPVDRGIGFGAAVEAKTTTSRSPAPAAGRTGL